MSERSAKLRCETNVSLVTGESFKVNSLAIRCSPHFVLALNGNDTEKQTTGNSHAVKRCDLLGANRGPRPSADGLISVDGLAAMHSPFTDHARYTVILPVPYHRLIYV